MEGVLLLTAILGGLGLFLALPGGRAHLGKLGLLILAAAAGALAYVLVRQLSETATQAWFVGLTLVGLWGGVGVITQRKPVYSALYFILVVISTSGLLLLAHAEFLFFAVLAIYAGAILVTYVFVIMLAQQGGGPAIYDRNARAPFFGCLAGFVLLGVLATQMIAAPAPPAAPDPAETAEAASVVNLGVALLTQYMVGLQVIGVLLLAAMVGAVAIARRRPLPEGEVEL